MSGKPTVRSYAHEIMAFGDKNRNFFRICYIVTRVVPEGLRKVFKQEWDALYDGTLHGPWEDTPANYKSFYSMEFKKNRRSKQHLLKMMTNGDRIEWDCTCLFYAIMYSDSVGPMLHPIVQKSVDDVRVIRNEVFAHNIDGGVTEADFQASINNIITAFKALKLDTTKLEMLKNRQPTFPTEEIKNVKQQLEDEKKRNAEPSSFCVLPAKPSHDTIDRMDEVGRIYEQMNRLSSEKKGKTTVVYLSGMPGCGKSEMARQIGEKYFLSDDTTDLVFIMTINASNMDTLLQSYVEFATRLKCHPNDISRIATSKDLSQENKINQLRALTVHQVDKYPCWLMIVDNVNDLDSFSKYRPQTGEKTRGGSGQILVTTQDSLSIFATSNTKHVPLSCGMAEEDAIELLSKVSGLVDDKEMMLKVAKALDLQPLALACAGVNMKCSRTTNTEVTWQRYLQDLEEGKHGTTETTTAVNLALKKEIQDEKMLFHAFQFLSVLAQEPIPLEYAVQYVMKCMPNEDEDAVASTICSSSFVVTSDSKTKTISVPHVVYHSCQNNQEKLKNVDMFVVIVAFLQLHSSDEESIEIIHATRQLVVHFTTIAKTLSSYIEQLPSETGFENVDDIVDCLVAIGRICHIHGHYKTAKCYYQICLAIQLSVYEHKGLLPKVKDVLNEIELALKPDHGQLEDTSLGKVLSAHGPVDYSGHSSLGRTLQRLGSTLQKLEQYDEEKSCYESALAIYETAHGEKHPLVGNIHRSLGDNHNMMKQYDEAKSCYERALAIYETVLSENHPCVGDIHNGLGLTLEKLEQYDEAKSYFERALAIYKTAYGENYPSVGDILDNLGKNYNAMGQYDEAKSCYEKALAIYKTAYDEHHPSIYRRYAQQPW
ncbi:hypothetical protein QZH41_000842 [Actinostola sp. cb2023]|nr:hypothetical protein QZH41_000842 [Actinostola sp. cb2023]